MQLQSIARALVALICIGNGLLAGAISLRQQGPRQPLVGGQAVVPGAIALSTKVHDDVDYKVVNKSSIKRNDTVDCLCELGSFWHWRIKSCIKQGGWGYECGFFPAEHHNKVCQDGLKCEVVEQNRVKYFHPGAVPASCQACEAEDKCLAGEKRHLKNCLKEVKLIGSACQTVRVTVTATASAKATEKVTKTVTASATDKATASAEAKEKDGKTASATATAEGKASATADATATASASAKATEEGVAEGKACITIDEVKALLNLKDVKRIGAVLSAQVVSRGDEEAFDKAYAIALDAAKKAGLLNAEEAAKAMAVAKAREHAGLDAQAKAEEAAAWKAEEGAEKNAQDKAKSDAMSEAQTAASQDAKSAADASAKAAADAKAAEAAAKAAEAAGDKDAAAAARQKADAAKAASAEAKARADAAQAKQEAIAAAEAKAAAAAKARQDAADALSDVVNPKPTSPPMRPTTAEPTNPPRKISPEQIAAKLP